MARDTRLLALRGAALAFWIACVVFVLTPSHHVTTSFHGGKLPAPKHTPARGA